jgi:hypothetical protein
MRHRFAPHGGAGPRTSRRRVDPVAGPVPSVPFVVTPGLR